MVFFLRNSYCDRYYFGSEESVGHLTQTFQPCAYKNISENAPKSSKKKS